MPRDISARLARAVSCYTGEAHESLRARIQAAPPDSALIPEPTQEQACLERQIFHTLAWPDDMALYPWGIKRVVPTIHGLTLELEGDHVAPHAAKLLPRIDEYEEVRGVPGLRVEKWVDEQLQLHVLGTSAAVTLTGLSRGAWETAVKNMSGIAREEGETMCDRVCSGALTEGEWWFARGMLQTAAPVAWVTSGLLRRIALFNTIGMPIYFTSWRGWGGGDELWCFDLDHQPRGDGCEHHSFLRALTDETFGLPLTVLDMRCGVDKPWHGSCSLDVGSSSGRPGQMNFRFNRRKGERVERWAQWHPEFMEAKQQMWGSPTRQPLASLFRWQLRRNRLSLT
ncbi:hypothetical protein [Streptacidiphilus albus]|uniref:hypothetical protein n=1 Tax=Streptacidiphilus albus TaxID=105425 RepID=UPI00054C1CA9|nr:hypothetical protein [Streptacidiphilus albus]